MFRYKLPLLLFILMFPALRASAPPGSYENELAELPKDPWVEQQMKSLELREKIAQLIFIRANLNEILLPEVDSLVEKYGMGGIVWFKGNPTDIARHTKRLQEVSKIPLLVCMDAEWGVGMRVDSAWSFPRQMTLGAVQDIDLVREMAAETGRQCRALGIQLNFAPVVDVNSNPKNPVINSRSFGEDPEEVARRGNAYVDGLREMGVLSTAKHFPGHGDTDKDSHHTLPVIQRSTESLEETDFIPFKALRKNEVDAVMTAHLEVLALEEEKGLPFTLSHKGVSRLLKQKLRFRGLVITDALEMKGVTEVFEPGTISVKAFIAGNDILLMPLDPLRALDSLEAAVHDGRISEKRIDHACRKVLLAKRNAHISPPLNPEKTNWQQELKGSRCEDIHHRIMQDAITLVSNQRDLIPLHPAPEKAYASLAINRKEPTLFQRTLSLYAPFDHYNLSPKPASFEKEGVEESLDDYSTIVVGLYGLSQWPQRNYGLDEATLAFIQELAEHKQVILTVFGNPYALNLLESTDQISGIQIAYEESDFAETAAAQALAGAIDHKGKLPVSINGYPTGTGIYTQSLGILSSVHPITAGLLPEIERKVDSLAETGIREKAYPSCQILLAKDGKIFYHKALGYQTYDSIMPVTTSDIYDLASLTKIMATTLALMKLYDEGLIRLDATLGDYLPELQGSNKAGLHLRDVLAHQAGLKPWIPFYKRLQEAEGKNNIVFSDYPDENFSINVCQGRYMHKAYLDTLWADIRDSDLLREKKYKYSDLGFYYLKEIIERVSDTPMQVFLSQHFYTPLGLAHTAFLPASIFCLNNIVPTEDDTAFRKMILRGDVHDPGAAMLGGVGGHAGLFSNASDMAVVMQMLINDGMYGGKRYLETETIREFTRQQFPLNKNRRGLGFDKPDPNDRKNGPGAPSGSLNSFGHSGFTGTYIWADADSGIVYVFLSNRTWPYGGENKLARMNIRTQILQNVYEHLIP